MARIAGSAPRDQAQPRRFVFRRDAIRQVDRAAIHEYALPGIVLMENAASALRNECLRRLAGRSRLGVLLLCGPGNNGGDGLALARKLHNERIPVSILLLAPDVAMKGDGAINLEVVRRMGLPIAAIDPANPAGSCAAAAAKLDEPAMIVDALFGTGLDRPLASPGREVVAWLNASRLRRAGKSPIVLSVDIPSGLDCDSGLPLGGTPEGAVRADITVTLAGLKIGFDAPSSAEYLGEVVVGDIGVPIELLARFAEQTT